MINNCQTLTCNRDLRQEKCVESRINRLKSLVQNWSRLPEQVYFVSTLKGKVTWYLCYFLVGIILLQDFTKLVVGRTGRSTCTWKSTDLFQNLYMYY